MPGTPTTSTGTLVPGSPVSEVDLSQEATSSPWQWALVALVVLLALVYLWRTYFSGRKPACASCGKDKSCCAMAGTTETAPSETANRSS